MSVRVRRATMALAGLFWIITFAAVGTGMAGCWGARRGMMLICVLVLSGCITAVLTIAAVLGQVLSPVPAEAYGLGARAAFRAAHDMPPPKGRHSRELAEARAEPARYAEVVRLYR
jgi:CHASE2 domain-containing sensor protein